MNRNHIFILSIGPVQSFIAQARKAQDLFGGSRLLSQLCLDALDYAKKNGVDVVFPVVNQQKSIPNRFVGTIRGSQEELKTLGEKIEEHIQDTFLKIAQKTKDKYHIGNITNFDEQIQQHLDIHWGFYPIETNYETDYTEAEKWFGAAKNIRQFQQLPERGRKCSLDGERNVKVYRLKDNEIEKGVLEKKLFQEEGDVHIIQNNSKIPLSLLSQGEGLSAVSFVKRDFETQTFPSTAEIALMDTMDESNEEFNLYRSLIGEDFDYQLCFEENLTKDYLKKNGIEYLLKKVKLDVLRDLQKKLFKGKEASKYYALIVFDGDRMGQIISGKNLKTTIKHKLKDFQLRTSELLAEYAEWAYTYLDNPKGQTIYAGGDDFMGFINLNYLYEVMQELYDQFNDTVNEILKSEFEGDLNENFNFTFSAGVVITHYKTPLSIVLKKAREMEHLAKEEGDRDAFAISVIKHSGESHATVYKWQHLANIKNINDQLQNENYSNTFIKNIQNEMNSLGVFRKKEFAVSGKGRDIARSEIKRLVERAKFPNQPKGSMKDDVIAIYQSSDSFNDFSEALNIAQFTKRQSIEK